MAGPTAIISGIPTIRDEPNFPQLFSWPQRKSKRPTDDSEVLSIVFDAIEKMSEAASSHEEEL